MNVNLIDLILIIIVMAFGVNGYHRGFTPESFRMIGIFIGICLCARYTRFLSKYVETQAHLSPEWLATLVAIVFLIAFTFLLTWVVNRIVQKVLKSGKLESIGGFLIGAIKGGVCVLIIAFILALLPFHALRKELKTNAYCTHRVILFLPSAIDFVTGSWDTPVAKNLKGVIDNYKKTD